MCLCAVLCLSCRDGKSFAMRAVSGLSSPIHGTAGTRGLLRLRRCLGRRLQVPELALGIRQNGASMREHFCCQCRYTHVLKTDDDCYIRYPALAATLQQPEIAGSNEGTSQMQMTGVYKGAGSPLLCMQPVLSEVCRDATRKVIAWEMCGKCTRDGLIAQASAVRCRIYVKAVLSP